MQKHTDHTFTFESADESVRVVVDSAVSLSVAGSAPITMPLEKLELVQEVLAAVIADADIAALPPVEEPAP